MAINVTKREPCPICGKPDYCFWSDNNERGIRYLFCHRTQGSYGEVVGNFVCCGSTATCSRWESMEDFEANTFKKGQTKKSCKKPEKPVEIMDKHQENVIASIEKRNAAYTEFIKLLKLEDKHRKYLFSEGWDNNMIEKYDIVSLPPLDYRAYSGQDKSCNMYRVEICQKLISKGIDLQHVPGFFINQKGKWTFAGNPGIVFPCFDIDGNVNQLRIRPDYNDEDIEYYRKIEKKPPKYVFFSSEVEKNGAKNNVQYSIYLPDGKFTPVMYLTEGEKKGIVIAAKRNTTAMCIQGVNCYGVLFKKDETGTTLLDKLIARGVKMFVVAYDSDACVNEQVLHHQQGLVEKLKENNIPVAVASWNYNVAKGIDDLIMLGLNPKPYFV